MTQEQYDKLYDEYRKKKSIIVSNQVTTVEQVKQKHQWKTPFNAVPEPGELNTLPSETVPDQSFTVKEIKDRFARGLPVTGERVPVWMGENDLTPENFTKFDLADQQQFIEEKAAEFEELKQRFLKEKAEKQEAARLRAEKFRRFEERIDQQEQQNSNDNPQS